MLRILRACFRVSLYVMSSGHNTIFSATALDLLTTVAYCGSIFGMDEKQVLTVQEVAAYLRVHENTVYTWLRNKQLRGVKFGRKWYLLKSQIDTLLSKQEVPYATDSSH